MKVDLSIETVKTLLDDTPYDWLTKTED